MAEIELLLPKMGESVAEATITSWLFEVGDSIEVEDSVVEIATDKVDSEVPSNTTGILVKKLYEVGDVAKVGSPIAIIKSDSAPETSELISTEKEVVVKNDSSTITPITLPDRKTTSKGTDTSFLSPLVKNIAKKENISQEELDLINGSGKNSRITKSDILNYITKREENTRSSADNKQDPVKNVSPAPNTPVESPAKSFSGESEIIEMDRMRKLISDNMLKSRQISAHVTSMVEVDVTNLVMWRNKVKDDFFKKEGVKLTFTPLFVEAVAKALRDFPMINISIDGHKIIVKKNINVGMAVALPSGNLIVPVVKNADQLNLIGLAKRVNDLAVKARNNKLDFSDISDGTFTITNIGTFGNAIGTPIINQPEVAIMSTGVIQKKPAVIETPQGDTIGIRQMMFLSMSYDHRVVDGMLGGSFLRRVADYLEKCDFNRQIW